MTFGGRSGTQRLTLGVSSPSASFEVGLRDGRGPLNLSVEG